MVTLQLRQIRIPPGQRVEFQDVSWQEFEAILQELGEHRGTRVAYSKGTLSAYEALGVAELWRYENRQLRIDLLQAGKYVEADSSPTFPGLPIIEVISDYVERSRVIGRSWALREFRQWVSEQK